MSTSRSCPAAVRRGVRPISLADDATRLAAGQSDRLPRLRVSQNTFLSRHISFDGRRLPNSPLQALRETHVGIQNAGLPLNRSRMTHSEADLTLTEVASLPDSTTVRHWDAVIDCAKSADARRRELRCVVSRNREVAGLHRDAQSKRRRPRSDWRASGCVTEARRRTSSGCVNRPLLCETRRVFPFSRLILG